MNTISHDFALWLLFCIGWLIFSWVFTLCRIFISWRRRVYTARVESYRAALAERTPHQIAADDAALEQSRNRRRRRQRNFEDDALALWWLS